MTLSLVVNQIKGEYQVKDKRMKKYLTEEKELIEGIKNFEIKSILREKNQEVDALSKYAFGVSLWQEVHCVETGGACGRENNDLGYAY